MVKKTSVQIELPKGILTVGSLIDYVEKVQEVWTESDTKYLGSVRDQTIIVEVPTGGFGYSKLIYDAGLGFVLLPLPESEYEDDTK